jgi:hypothetical protein
MAKSIKFPHNLGYKELLSCDQLFLELLDSCVAQGGVSVKIGVCRRGEPLSPASEKRDEQAKL